MTTDLGLLLFRLGFGGMMLLQHGLPKLVHASERLLDFPNPVGMGAGATFVYAVFAELFCAFAVVIGLFTRLACIPLVCTMFVARFFVYPHEPFRSEYLMLYLIAFAVLIFLGPGRFSLDRRWNPIKRKRKP